MREEKKAAPAAVAGPSEKWRERWYGSGGAPGYEGWSIVNDRTNALVAYLGRGVSSEAVREIVWAHNAAAPTTQAAPQREVFDEDGFRAWVIRNLPDNTIIGNSAWWADHLAAWVQRFMLAAPQTAPVAQGDALTPGDADQLEKVITDFEECGETDVPDETLQRFAAMGYLECVHYNVLPAAHEAIDAARSQAKEGGA